MSATYVEQTVNDVAHVSSQLRSYQETRTKTCSQFRKAQADTQEEVELEFELRSLRLHCRELSMKVAEKIEMYYDAPKRRLEAEHIHHHRMGGKESKDVCMLMEIHPKLLVALSSACVAVAHEIRWVKFNSASKDAKVIEIENTSFHQMFHDKFHIGADDVRYINKALEIQQMLLKRTSGVVTTFPSLIFLLERAISMMNAKEYVFAAHDFAVVEHFVVRNLRHVAKLFRILRNNGLAYQSMDVASDCCKDGQMSNGLLFLLEPERSLRLQSNLFAAFTSFHQWVAFNAALCLRLAGRMAEAEVWLGLHDHIGYYGMDSPVKLPPGLEGGATFEDANDNDKDGKGVEAEGEKSPGGGGGELSRVSDIDLKRGAGSDGENFFIPCKSLPVEQRLRITLELCRMVRSCNKEMDVTRLVTYIGSVSRPANMVNAINLVQLLVQYYLSTAVSTRMIIHEQSSKQTTPMSSSAPPLPKTDDPAIHASYLDSVVITESSQLLSALTNGKCPSVTSCLTEGFGERLEVDKVDKATMHALISVMNFTSSYKYLDIFAAVRHHDRLMVDLQERCVLQGEQEAENKKKSSIEEPQAGGGDATLKKRSFSFLRRNRSSSSSKQQQQQENDEKLPAPATSTTPLTSVTSWLGWATAIIPKGREVLSNSRALTSHPTSRNASFTETSPSLIEVQHATATSNIGSSPHVQMDGRFFYPCSVDNIDLTLTERIMEECNLIEMLPIEDGLESFRSLETALESLSAGFESLVEKELGKQMLDEAFEAETNVALNATTDGESTDSKPHHHHHHNRAELQGRQHAELFGGVGSCGGEEGGEFLPDAAVKVVTKNEDEDGQEEVQEILSYDMCGVGGGSNSETPGGESPRVMAFPDFCPKVTLGNVVERVTLQYVAGGGTNSGSFGNKPHCSKPITVLSDQQRKDLHGSLPLSIQHCDWSNIYSTNHHGMSLNTLYINSQEMSNVILVVETHRSIIGAYLAAPIKLGRSFSGLGDSFVWTIRDKTEENSLVEIYRWSRENDYFCLARPEGITIGGGSVGGPAIYINEDMIKGASSECKTFNSPILVLENAHTDVHIDKHREFDVFTVELYEVLTTSKQKHNRLSGKRY